MGGIRFDAVQLARNLAGAPECATIDDLHKTVFCYSVFDRPPDLKFGRILKNELQGEIKM